MSWVREIAYWDAFTRRRRRQRRGPHVMAANLSAGLLGSPQASNPTIARSKLCARSRHY